jgi:hypothetical protein
VQRSQQLAATFLLGAFLVGGTLGFTVDRMVGDRLLEQDASAHAVVDAFAAELDLSSAQRAAVDSILAERNRVMDSLIAPVRPQIRAARDSARQRIALRLTAPQRRKFATYLERMRKEYQTHD